MNDTESTVKIGRPSNLADILSILEVGQGFNLPDERMPTVRSNISWYGRHHAKAFSVRRLDSGHYFVTRLDDPPVDRPDDPLGDPSGDPSDVPPGDS